MRWASARVRGFPLVVSPTSTDCCSHQRSGHRVEKVLEVIMKFSRQFRKVVARPATAAVLTMGLLAAAPLFSSSVTAQAAARSCTTPVTSAPTGPATVSTASTSFGRALIVGAGANRGCSLYILTSDRLHSQTFGLAAFACSNGANPIGQPCDSVLWPALLTNGHPIAGPGGQGFPPRDRDPYRRALRHERAAGDLRRSAALPVLP